MCDFEILKAAILNNDFSNAREVLNKIENLAREPQVKGILVEVHSDIGRRNSMEDDCIVFTIDDDTRLFGVFDGHGGKSAVEHFKRILPLKIQEEIKNDGFEGIEDRIPRLFQEIDKEWFDEQYHPESWGADTSGTTFTGVLISLEKVITINVGDSRTIIYNESGCAVSTKDHKAADDENGNMGEEMKLAVARGGSEDKKEVYPCYRGRVTYLGFRDDIIAVTRALGDVTLKNAIRSCAKGVYAGDNAALVPTPDVVDYSRKNCYIIFMCSDGVTDVLNENEIWEIISKNESGAANMIINEATKRGSGDNKTAMILRNLF